MYAITGITGNIGGQLARILQDAHQPVRAVLRDPGKAPAWVQRGFPVAIADIADAAALTQAFAGAEAIFVLVPPIFDPSPGFPEAQAIAASLKSALEKTRPGRVLHLSTIGAQAAESNLLSQHSLIENTLRELSIPVTFLRPGWFLENSSWDVAPARANGVIPSFLQPLNKPVPMVATADIAQTAAALLQETWQGHRVVELEGPERVTPNQIAAAFADLLGRPVKMEAVPRATWEALFFFQGMKNPGPRMRMLDGFNEGWIEFESGEAGSRKGTVTVKTVLKGLIEREAND